MDGIREYILCITAAALVCSALKLLMGEKGTMAAMVKLLCGLFLCITAVRPLIRLEIGDLSGYVQSFGVDASLAASEGEAAAAKAFSAIIKSETEAYILDKAESVEAAVTVEVTLSGDDPPLPCAVTITGACSPYAKTALRTFIEQDIGIPREAQTWIS